MKKQRISAQERKNVHKSVWLRAAAVSLAVVTLLAAACGSEDTTTATTTTAPATTTTATTQPPAMPMEKLVVGYILPSTGALAFLNEPMVEAVQMAASEINAMAGDYVELIPGDSGTDPAVASATADDLLARNVSAIVGAAASGISLSIIDKITGEEVVMMSPSNTSPTFTTYDDGGYYFRTAPPDLLQAQVLGDVVADDGVSRAGILYRADDYGQNLAEALERQLVSNGVTIATSIAYDPEGSSFDAEIQQLVEATVDGIVLIAFEEGGPIIAGMIEAGIGPSDVPLFMGDGTATGNLWELVDENDPSLLMGAKATGPSSAPEDGEPTFTERFRAFAGPDTQTIFSAHAYDALVIIALAAMAAESTDPTVFVNEINDVTRGGTKCSSFAECCELIAAGEDIDYDGASGPLDFTDAGEPGAGSYDISTFGSDGSLSPIAQVLIEGS